MENNAVFRRFFVYSVPTIVEIKCETKATAKTKPKNRIKERIAH